MPTFASNYYIATVCREVDAGAHRLARQLNAQSHEIEDFRQELLVDLLTRLPRYDAGRGGLGAFAGAIVSHKVARLRKAIRRERALFGSRPASLDDPVPDTDGLSRGDLVSEEDGYPALLGQPVGDVEVLDRRLSLRRGLEKLPVRDRLLCLALASWSAAELVGLGAITRSSLYRQIAGIRLALTAFGVTGV